jgi:hypothetical protein
MKADDCDRVTAMRKARQEYPEEFAAFLGLEPVEKADSTRERFDGEQAKRKWNDAVEATRAACKCSSTEAMTRTRKSQPELYAAFVDVNGGQLDNPRPWETERKDK